MPRRRDFDLGVGGKRREDDCAADGVLAPYSSIFFMILQRSSLVGVRIRADGLLLLPVLGRSIGFCMIGRANAAVFPVPVWSAAEDPAIQYIWDCLLLDRGMVW